MKKAIVLMMAAVLLVGVMSYSFVADAWDATPAPMDNNPNDYLCGSVYVSLDLASAQSSVVHESRNTYSLYVSLAGWVNHSFAFSDSASTNSSDSIQVDCNYTNVQNIGTQLLSEHSVFFNNTQVASGSILVTKNGDGPWIQSNW